ncbi:ribonuclease HII [Methylotenera versatilis]|uniref:ribonuclease HII n=1 Tax=Methylotenera versatilis TaxID=1055487 RepID=UPI000646262A|nr:ribonuclease HII [Methylotenera versatilis]
MAENNLICGVDEAGRGPLAGGVYAAAVILDINQPIIGLADSKKLSEKRRDFLSAEIKAKALAWAIASCTAQEIDEINILQASLLAMKRAIEAMQVQFNIMPNLVQVDGNKCPKIDLPCEAIVQGDSKVQAISAASILAKVARDAECYALDAVYPQYDFAKHKGYPTALHLQMLTQYGVTPIHRKSYAPVRRLLSQQ